MPAKRRLPVSSGGDQPDPRDVIKQFVEAAIVALCADQVEVETRGAVSVFTFRGAPVVASASPDQSVSIGVVLLGRDVVSEGDQARLIRVCLKRRERQAIQAEETHRSQRERRKLEARRAKYGKLAARLLGAEQK